MYEFDVGDIAGENENFDADVSICLAIYRFVQRYVPFERERNTVRTTIIKPDFIPIVRYVIPFKSVSDLGHITRCTRVARVRSVNCAHPSPRWHNTVRMIKMNNARVASSLHDVIYFNVYLIICCEIVQLYRCTLYIVRIETSFRN